MKILASLGRDAIVYGASDFAFKLVAFSVFPIYAHTFSVHDFGIIELVTVTSSLLAMFCGLGLNNAVQRFYWEPGISREEQRSLVTSGLLLQIGFSSVLVLGVLASLYPFRENLAENYGITWVVAILGLAGIIPSMTMQYVLDVLRLQFAPWRYTSVAFLRNIVGVAVGLLLILVYGFGIVGIFIGTAVAGVLAIPFGLWMIERDIHFRFNLETACSLLKFGHPFVFAGLAYWILGALDRWMLAQLSSVEDVGLYGIAFKFATVLMFINTAFGQAWSPWAMKIRAEHKEYRKVYAQTLLLWFLILTTVACVLSVFAKELLSLMTPKTYWPAANILVMAVLGVVFLGTTQVTALGISIEKQTRILAITAWGGAIANVILNVVLIPFFGALGAATATTIAYLGLSGTYLYWTQKLHPLPLNWPQLTVVFLVATGVVPIAWFLNNYESSLQILFAKTLISLCPPLILWRCGLSLDKSTHFASSGGALAK